MRHEMKRDSFDNFESVAGKQVERWSYHDGRHRDEHMPDFSLCGRAVNQWFVIPKEVKKFAIITGKQEHKDAYKMYLTSGKNAGHCGVKIWNPIKEKYQGHMIYHRTWSHFHETYKDKVFYARIEVYE